MNGSDGCLMQALEARILLSSEPALYRLVGPPSPGAAPVQAESLSASPSLQALSYPSVNSVLTADDRVQLVNNWTGPTADRLKLLLHNRNIAAFDQQLLDYMKSRTSSSFYFQPGDVPADIRFIDTYLPTQMTPVISNANKLLSGLYPVSDTATNFTVQLSSGFSWVRPDATHNMDFLHYLNHNDQWVTLAEAYRDTGNASYVNEVIGQLASWSQQNPPLADPNSWQSTEPRWWLLDAAYRAQNWLWTYYLVLGSSGWTPEANTLFLHRLWQHGDFLYRATPHDLTSNQSLMQATGLLFIADVFPEFKDSAAWESYGRNLLFRAMDAQFYSDGGHYEQSPSYGNATTEALLNAYWLDKLNGKASQWPADRLNRLGKSVEALYQILSPDGQRPPLSDGLRSASFSLFTNANVILNTSRYPATRPRLRDVWMFGPSAMQPLLSAPANPPLTNRGASYALPASGYYMMRSGDDPNARQITFDAGPVGGLTHGHLDLFSFELFGYGQPLIADMGRAIDNTSDRPWAIGTPGHNTISIDGLNHADIEGEGNPAISVQWAPAADHVQVTASHNGYQYLGGRPVVARTIWYDLDGTMLIIDWAEASEDHTYTISYTLPGTTASAIQSDGSIYNNNGSSTVHIQPLLLSGQRTGRESRYTYYAPAPNVKQPAIRYTVSQRGRFVAFATLITAYNGSEPAVTATWQSRLRMDRPLTVMLHKNGTDIPVTLNPPAMSWLNATATTPASYNHVAYDSKGNLHMAWYDPSAHALKYSVRSAASGQWSAVETIDTGPDVGLYLSLAVDNNDAAGVAYFDAWGGDLKYAHYENGHWVVRTVDSRGSTGLYPSLAYGLKGVPFIGYYNRTLGDLRFATLDAAGTGWTITTVDSAGDVGRHASMARVPNLNARFGISYEDTTHGTFKYAELRSTGWKIWTADATTRGGGGYTSMAFDPTGMPSFSYYDAYNADVRFARWDGSRWTVNVVASAGRIGLYTNLLYDPAGKAEILYFSKSTNQVFRSVGSIGSWRTEALTSGGRALSAAISPRGVVSYSGLDSAGALLDVRNI